MNKLTLDENAKDDWLKLVKKHKKKQKGLPALSTLNTNAGDVETHIKMFNKMTSPTESPNNNPVSGPFGGDVSLSTEISGGLAESIDLFEGKENFTEGTNMNNEKVELYYTDLELEDAPNYIATEYTYVVTKQDVIEVLQDLPELQKKYWTDDVSEEEFEQLLVDKFDDLFEEFESAVLDHFRKSAENEARENLDPYSYFDDTPEYDPHDQLDESEKNLHEGLDDDFDLSLRAIL